MKKQTSTAMLLVGALALRAADFENEYVTMTFDAAGRLVSLQEKATGRELVGEKLPFVEARDADDKAIAPTSMARSGDRLTFTFPKGSCTVVLTAFEGGWTVRCESCDVADAAKLVLAQVKPSCNERKGDMSNAVLDDRSGVVVRGYRPEVRMTDPDVVEEYCGLVVSRKTCAWVDRSLGFAGKSAGIAAGPADKLLDMLANMAVAGDVPRIKSYGKGRVFYTSFGHDNRAFLDPPRLLHIMAGLQYAIGDIEAGVPCK